MAFGEMKYEVECLVCRRKFRVPQVTSKIPKHPLNGENPGPYIPYVPCPGSGQMGIPIGPVIEGFD
jgi:hypothetical protein